MKTYSGLTMGSFEEAFSGEKRLAFTPKEYRSRLEKVRRMMADSRIDLLWITAPEHICWLHGYYAGWYKASSPMRYPQCYGTAIHVNHDEVIHFDNPTEMPLLATISVCENLCFFNSRDAADNIPFIVKELSARGWLDGTVALEKWSYVPNPAISTMFEGALLAQGVRVVDGSHLLRKARTVKSQAEIEKIEIATSYADVGWEEIRRELRPGMTELDLFGLTTAAMMKAGSEFPALIPIFNALPVRDGRPISTGHSMAGRRVIEMGQFVCADLCGVHDRYHSNVMRGIYLGDPPAELIRRYEKAGEVFDLFRTEVRSGMTVREVNALIRICLAESGLDNDEGWVLGYELGLSLPPDWVGEFYFHYQDTKFLDRIFEENMVTNLECLFSTWLIDTVVYTQTGCRLLSKTPLDVLALC